MTTCIQKICSYIASRIHYLSHIISVDNTFCRLVYNQVIPVFKLGDVTSDLQLRALGQSTVPESNTI